MMVAEARNRHQYRSAGRLDEAGQHCTGRQQALFVRQRSAGWRLPPLILTHVVSTTMPCGERVHDQQPYYTMCTLFHVFTSLSNKVIGLYPQRYSVLQHFSPRLPKTMIETFDRQDRFQSQALADKAFVVWLAAATHDLFPLETERLRCTVPDGDAVSQYRSSVGTRYGIRTQSSVKNKFWSKIEMRQILMPHLMRARNEARQMLC
jgi:hypothetical protein